MQRSILRCGGFCLILSAVLVSSLQLGRAEAIEGRCGQDVAALPEPACSIEDHSDAATEDTRGNRAESPDLTNELAVARKFLLDTAQAGYTMMRQGPELAIARLHPAFVIRLAGAIREARAEGLSAGIFSAYRPPAFGVGGFSDKFNSLHSYGLAVDMYGIGAHDSAEANRWHEIAGTHGVVCPYGPQSRKEWNHCQPTTVKIVLKDDPLRETITREGPRHLETMFAVGSAVIATGPALSMVNGSAGPQPASDVPVPPQAPRESFDRTVVEGVRLTTNTVHAGPAVKDTRGRSRRKTALLRSTARQPSQLQSATETARARLKRLTAAYARTDWARHIAALRRTRSPSLAHPRSGPQRST
jgi:hypothetical protein